MDRNAKWYYQAYEYLSKYKDYKLYTAYYLDFMYIHIRLKYIKNNKWLGPEVVKNNISGQLEFSHLNSFKDEETYV